MKSSRSHVYAVPDVYRDLFKHKLDQLVAIGVLKKCDCADWVSGTFIVPKKDNQVQWGSNFCALNKAIKRKFYPLPKISEILL